MLLHQPLDRIQEAGGDTVAEAVRRMRAADVHVTAGYDGEFGVIKVFSEQERQSLDRQAVMFQGLNEPIKKPTQPKTNPKAKTKESEATTAHKEPPPAVVDQGPLAGLNPDQHAAATHAMGPALILAGPGTGKTRVLTCRVAHLIEQGLAQPANILAVTFTNKAAGEMRERLDAMLPSGSARVRDGLHLPRPGLSDPQG